MNDKVVLGIETSGILCSIAWWQHDQTLLEYNIEERNAHATLIAGLVEKGFTKLNLNADNIEMVAVAAGPGSFTGLRIGMAYAKGFCFGNDLPLIPVTNFEVLAHSNLQHGPVLALIEARKGYYYIGEFLAGEKIPKRQYLAKAQDIMQQVKPNYSVIVHEEITPGTIENILPQTTTIVPANYSAGVVCALGYRKYKQNDILNIDQVEPAYLQPFAGVL